MYGGKIIDNTAVKGGGAIEVENAGSSFNMYGGEIKNNHVNGPNDNLHKGGGVHFAAGSVTIYGTGKDIVITGNTITSENKENNLLWGYNL